jgi:chaperonin GroES
MKIQPVGNRVLLKRLPQEKTKGGLLLPDSSKNPQIRLEVIEVGDGEEIRVKTNDIVLMERYAGTEVTINDEDYIIVESKQIIAIVNE